MSMARPERDDVTAAELHAFLDQQLSGPDETKVVDFLDRHPDRQRIVRGLMHDKEQLVRAADADELEPDEGIETLAACLTDRLARAERKTQVRRWSARLAAAVVLVGAGWTGHTVYTDRLASDNGFVQTATPAPVTDFLATAAGAHSVFATDRVRPVEYTADAETALADWFGSHFKAPVEIPHLEGIGFTFLGGRLLATAEGPLAQLVYESPRGDRVSLFFAERSMLGGSELKLVKVGKTYASYWQDDSFTYAVVEEAPGADIGVVATQIAGRAQNPGDGS
jgi:anti-sigma factor RsiW